MSNFSELIIPKIYAQAADAIAQPTFGTLSTDQVPEVLSKVTLTSDKTSVKVGEKFKVRVKIELADNVKISEYRIVLDFTPTTLLSVQDADSAIAGTQITLLDDVFKITDPENNNTVSSQAGRIRLVAKTETGNSLALNRDVAEIEFQAQALGVASISIAQGTTGTQLIKDSDNGTSVAFSINELTVNVTQGEIIVDPGTNNGGVTTGEKQLPTKIPDTALSPTLESLLPFFTGIIILLLGLKLRSGRKVRL